MHSRTLYVSSLRPMNWLGGITSDGLSVDWCNTRWSQHEKDGRFEVSYSLPQQNSVAVILTIYLYQRKAQLSSMNLQSALILPKYVDMLEGHGDSPGQLESVPSQSLAGFY